MTVAFDAVTQSNFGAVSPYSFNHTPVGTPKGVVVFVTRQAETVASFPATPLVSAITYGGVALGRVVRATWIGSEDAETDCWFLGAGIPTGVQAVSISNDGSNVENAYVFAFTLTAAADTEVGDFDSLAIGSTTAASVTLTTAINALRLACTMSGRPTIGNLTALAGFTNKSTADPGVYTFYTEAEDAVASGAVVTGWLADGADDICLTALAVQELTVPAAVTSRSTRSPRYGLTRLARR